ncbi:MAG: hypothetical protein EZS26_003024 [Candidatus Ordinivivax streblomastigis]|uniref:YgjP-like metallopeptidase domain-containing protein n=1 Tax=Candidatus Ordinivivax streblomastigis TaxID=2540710 RepID=A0A5M8NVD9_9BACT|nr:MAG: hypothetical protein EZS26_003024 [Candidatus Ordinivivax streblomastigis]
MVEEFEDEELGRLIVRVNMRAKNIVFRTKSDAIYISVPPRTHAKEIRDAIEKLRGKLSASRQKVSMPLIDVSFQIDTELFKLTLTTGTQSEKFFIRNESEVVKIICPPETNFNDEKIQHWLRRVIEETVRKKAKRILPPRLRLLSQRCGLPYQDVKINSSRGRWGSCSAKKTINLSLFLLLLPQHLIDYVLLHELCHTREMNHSVRFWELLDSFTDDKALQLREELKGYKTEIAGIAQ